MSIDEGRPSAKIYQFPRRVAKKAGDLRRNVDPLQIPVTYVEFGSGWYHEAAVKAESGRRPLVTR